MSTKIFLVIIIMDTIQCLHDFRSVIVIHCVITKRQNRNLKLSPTHEISFFAVLVSNLFSDVTPKLKSTPFNFNITSQMRL